MERVRLQIAGSKRKSSFASFKDSIRTKYILASHGQALTQMPKSMQISATTPPGIYGLLIKCAVGSIIKLTADPHYVGGRIGVMAVLHTWDSNLSHHLYVHCLVTGGGLSVVKNATDLYTNGESTL
jgi:hypothetical protein